MQITWGTQEGVVTLTIVPRKKKSETRFARLKVQIIFISIFDRNNYFVPKFLTFYSH